MFIHIEKGNVIMSKRIWFGGLFLIFGLGILFHQVGLWDFKYILKTWWPIIFIIIGVSRLTNQRESSHIVSFIFILVGSILLLNQWIDINVTAFIWPLIFILIGLTIIF